MDPRQNFWLALHQLAEAIEGSGPTDVERTDAILESLNDLSPSGHKDAMKELAAVLVELELLHSLGRLQATSRGLSPSH